MGSKGGGGQIFTQKYIDKKQIAYKFYILLHKSDFIKAVVVRVSNVAPWASCFVYLQENGTTWKEVLPNVKLFGNDGAIIQEAAKIHDAYC